MSTKIKKKRKEKKEERETNLISGDDSQLSKESSRLDRETRGKEGPSRFARLFL